MFRPVSSPAFRLAAAWLALLLSTPTIASAQAATERAPDVLLTLRRGNERETVRAYLDAGTQRGFVTVGEGEARFVSPVYALWSVSAADFDGDGTDELLLGIWSSTKRHEEPEPHRTLWVLRWDGHALVPLWRGSALSRPLRSAMPARLDEDGRADLLALERQHDTCSVAAYAWTGFGFAVAARRSVPCSFRLAELNGCMDDGARARCARLVQGEIELP